MIMSEVEVLDMVTLDVLGAVLETLDGVTLVCVGWSGGQVVGGGWWVLSGGY